MVYIASWQDFQRAAEDLYAKSPNKTRYCVKWKSSEGKLVLKITDDTTCLKFKTHSSIFLNRFEALNLSLMEKMQNRRPKELSPEPVRASTPQPGPSSTIVPTPGTPAAAAAVKKKKPKKKK